MMDRRGSSGEDTCRLGRAELPDASPARLVVPERDQVAAWSAKPRSILQGSGGPWRRRPQVREQARRREVVGTPSRSALPGRCGTRRAAGSVASPPAVNDRAVPPRRNG